MQLKPKQRVLQKFGCWQGIKLKFYAASESLNFRVTSAVFQKNIGVTYIEQVYKVLNLSPAKVSKEFRESKKRSRKRKIEQLQIVEAKRKRLFCKKNLWSKTVFAQHREGITHETDSRLNDVSGLIDEKPYQDSSYV
ncbi:uncharacterized protein LOC107273581 isoform X2 [Cephus cinctus]|uniref:Uncharacterized protein LOC107273581 isoform X2 n=1 Tax=Cephus cinctus TaxID=211228 RepID=A0AAJ7CCR1_CEPCN|nr:uncharacterized protein LOC107273581 isoform X2 [Cephus cinctus]